MKDKEAVRSAWSKMIALNKAVPSWGKAAEKLRSLQPYRGADTVFAAPGDSLHQARINCLVDGKNLVMPAPSIRAGFFYIPAHSIQFKDLATAVTYKGLEKYGQQLKSVPFTEHPVGVLLTESLAIDLEGGRIGDGKGFFDLCTALLQEQGSLHQDWTVYTIISEEQISRDNLPQDKWDIKVSGAITPLKIHAFDTPLQKPQIFWDVLDRARIKRIDPLWKLYSKRLKAEGRQTK
jgi:5-formyltetrahydrofolate cyclo-ligase